MKKQILLISSLLIIALSSCTGIIDTSPLPTMSDQQGAIMLNVEPSSVITKSSGILVPTSADFNISIDSLLSDGTLKNFYDGAFSSIDTYMVLYAGNYTATALSGENEAFSLEKPTFSATTDFTVYAQRTASVELIAIMESFAVEVNYSDELLSAFSEIYIEAEIDNATYTFAVGASEIAYLDPCDVILTLCGTTTEGVHYSSVIKSISSQGREHYILDISLRPSGNEFSIEVDTNVISYDIEDTLDEELYPELGSATTGAMEFYETAVLEGGFTDNALITLAARVETESLTLQFIDEKFSSYGFDTERVYDFSVAEDVEALTALGMVIPEGGVLNNSNNTICVGTLPSVLETQYGETTQYAVRLTSTAKYQSGEDVTDFNITVKPPVFTMPDVDPVNVWSKEFTYEAIAGSNISQGDFETMTSRNDIVYEYSYDLLNWVTIAQDTYTVGNLTQSTSGTTVYLRAKYRYTYSENTVTLTTEATTQIPNNTFATYYYTENNGQPCYWFYASGASSADQWWATRNEMTTSEGIDAKYTRYSGSRPNSGGGIYLVTCGWGSGNTAAGSWSMIYNIWAGKVFLGTYSADSYDNDTNESHGKEFTSRPTGVTFDYTYDYYKSGDMYVAEIWAENRTGGVTTQLAYASASDGTEKSSWTSKTLTLTYTNTSLPITHLCVSFQSGIYENPSDDENKSGYVKDPSFASSDPGVGSVFCVNNVTLIYGK